jgi:hypothetical protein
VTAKTPVPKGTPKLCSLFTYKQATLTLNYTITTMPEETIFDPTDKGTLRPNAKPLRVKGDAFYPMKLPDFS